MNHHYPILEARREEFISMELSFNNRQVCLFFSTSVHQCHLLGNLRKATLSLRWRHELNPFASSVCYIHSREFKRWKTCIKKKCFIWSASIFSSCIIELIRRPYLCTFPLAFHRDEKRKLGDQSKYCRTTNNAVFIDVWMKFCTYQWERVNADRARASNSQARRQTCCSPSHFLWFSTCARGKEQVRGI